MLAAFLLAACGRSPHPEIKKGYPITHLLFTKGPVWSEEKCEKCGKWHRNEFTDKDKRELMKKDLQDLHIKVVGNTPSYLIFSGHLDLGFGGSDSEVRVPWEFIEKIETKRSTIQ